MANIPWSLLSSGWVSGWLNSSSRIHRQPLLLGRGTVYILRKTFIALTQNNEQWASFRHFPTFTWVTGPVVGGEANISYTTLYGHFLFQLQLEEKWWQLLCLPLEGRLVKFWNVYWQLRSHGNFSLAFKNLPALDKRPESPEIRKSKVSAIAVDKSRFSSSSFSLGVYSTLGLP